jgi:hypothetical protein
MKRRNRFGPGTSKRPSPREHVTDLIGKHPAQASSVTPSRARLSGRCR